MTMLAGAFALDDTWSPHALARQLAQGACRYPGMHSRLLLHDRRIACYVIERQEQKSGTWQLPVPENHSVYVVGHIAAAEKDTQTVLQELAAQKSASWGHLDGAWNALIYDHDTESLRFISDRLGTAWLYIAKFSKGYVFCSDFGTLVSHFPETLTVDYETLLVILGINYPPDNKTCFTEITILPPGEMSELHASGVRITAPRQIVYGDRYVSLPAERKYELLDALFAETVQAWCAPEAANVLVSLSSGYDSRYGLALLLQHAGIRPRCLTFGHPRSPDVRFARALCQQLGLPWALYPVETTSWEVWQRAIAQLGVTGGFQWSCGWAEEWLTLLQEHGSHVLLGFLGDAISGKHLVQYPGQEEQWLDNWERWSLEAGWVDSPLLYPAANRRLREAVRTRLVQVCEPVRFALPHQKALHLDWYGRQRRFTASQYNLLAKFLVPIPFFSTESMLDFWANVSFEDLKDQHLYLAYARSRFPDFFTQQRRATFSKRVWGTMTNALIDVFPASKNLFSPSEIDVQKLILLNKPHFFQLLKDVAPKIDQIFSMEALYQAISAFPHTSKLNSLQLMRLINVCILLQSGKVSA